MLSDALTVSFALHLLLGSNYFALALPSSRSIRSPGSPSRGSLHVPLRRRAEPQRNETEFGLWVKQQKQALEGKYGGGGSSNTKRSSGSNLLVNQDLDSSYYGSIAVGTPAVAYEVVLDTGSADLWLVDSQCGQNCNGFPPYTPSSSSTFSNSSKPFAITYGSGQASGYLAQDVVQMAGFQVSNQSLGLCDQISDGLLIQPVSELMGLGWQALSSSGATPFWQALYQGNAFDEPLMAFYLTRFQNVTGANQQESGGVFTLGTTNSSLYTGDIDYQDIPSNFISYWTLPIKSLTVNSNSVSIPSGQSSYAAIDTGTTLIGGPASEVAALYAQIPNAVAGTGNYVGYYLYPCSTTVNVAFNFGGQSWSISAADFKLSQTSSSQCVGSIFEFTGSDAGPGWIIGDTFLKNVYSVFRANPPSVGFAALAAGVQSSVTENGVPTPTIGSVSVSVTGSSSGSGRAQNAALPSRTPYLASLLFAATSSFVLFLLI
jgi:hypothetical protein